VGGVVSTYAYNGLGQRTSQTVGGTTTEYVLDTSAGLSAGLAGGPSTALRPGLPEVIVATTGGSSTYYVQVGGQILAQYGSGAWAYALPDHLGSVRQLTNAGGQVTLAQSFDPFGGLFEAAGLGASDFGYMGEQVDAGTELVFLRARYYNPGVGRFLTRDVWKDDPQNPSTLNKYLYAFANPLSYRDPQGLVPIPPVMPPCTDPGLMPDGYYEEFGFAFALGLGMPGFGTFRGSDLPIPIEPIARAYNTAVVGIQIVYDYEHRESAAFAYYGLAWDPLQLVGLEAIYGQGFIWGFRQSHLADYAGYTLELGGGWGPSVPVILEAGFAGVASLPLSAQGKVLLDKPVAVGLSVATEIGLSIPVGIPGSPEEGSGGNVAVIQSEMMSDIEPYTGPETMSNAIQNSGAALVAQWHWVMYTMPVEWSLFLQRILGLKYYSPIHMRDLGLRRWAAELPYRYER